MTDIEAEVKRWGNSLGIRVPAALAHDQGIVPGDIVHVRIEKWTRPEVAAFGAGRKHASRYDAYLKGRKALLLREERAADRRLGLR